MLTAILAAVNHATSRKSMGPDPRLSQLLRYLVEETLAGRGAGITGTSVAIDVFGRSPQSASEGDALVRVQARQLRLKLQDHYAANQRTDLRIQIPKGSYRPLFQTEIIRPDAEDTTKITLVTEPIQILHPDTAIAPHAIGLMDEIETALYRFRDFSVQPQDAAAPSNVCSAFTLRLTGKAERQGGTLRFSFHVRGGRRNNILWSRYYALDLIAADVSLARNQIAELVAVAVGCPSSAITKSLVADWPDQPTATEPPILTVLRCHKYTSRPNAQDYLPLRDALTRVTQQQPNMASAWARLSALYLDGIRFNFDPATSPAELADHARNCAQMAIEQDHTDAQSWYALGYMQIVTRDFERGIIAAEKALALNPLWTDALAELGHQYWIFNKRARGLEMVNRAIALNENAPGWYKFCLVEDALMQRDFKTARRILAEINMSEFFWVQFLEAVTSGHLEDRKDAARALDQLDCHAPWLLPNFATDHDQ